MGKRSCFLRAYQFPRNRFGSPPVYGSVNIGGWFVLEPFISPALYQKYPGAVDEWTLSTLMAADTASGGLGQLEQHYDTFVVRQVILGLIVLHILTDATPNSFPLSIHALSIHGRPSRPK